MRHRRSFRDWWLRSCRCVIAEGSRFADLIDPSVRISGGFRRETGGSGLDRPWFERREPFFADKSDRTCRSGDDPVSRADVTGHFEAMSRSFRIGCVEGRAMILFMQGRPVPSRQNLRAKPVPFSSRFLNARPHAQISFPFLPEHITLNLPGQKSGGHPPGGYEGNKTKGRRTGQKDLLGSLFCRLHPSILFEQSNGLLFTAVWFPDHLRPAKRFGGVLLRFFRRQDSAARMSSALQV